MTVAYDAGERVAAERDRARYKAIVEAQTDWIARQRPDGRLTFVNQAYCHWMGMSAEELLSPDYWGLDLVDDPEDLARFHANRASLRPERASAINELRTPPSRRQQALGAVDRYRDIRRRRQGHRVPAVGREITEQKQTEIALRHSEERYRDVVESQNDLITRVAPTGGRLSSMTPTAATWA